jgi:hypothetical protein
LPGGTAPAQGLRQGSWNLKDALGSEVYVPVRMGRRAIGIELKESYYRQAVKNVEAASKEDDSGEEAMLYQAPPEDSED